MSTDMMSVVVRDNFDSYKPGSQPEKPAEQDPVTTVAQGSLSEMTTSMTELSQKLAQVPHKSIIKETGKAAVAAIEKQIKQKEAGSKKKDEGQTSESSKGGSFSRVASASKKVGTTASKDTRTIVRDYALSKALEHGTGLQGDINTTVIDTTTTIFSELRDRYKDNMKETRSKLELHNRTLFTTPQYSDKDVRSMAKDGEPKNLVRGAAFASGVSIAISLVKSEMSKKLKEAENHKDRSKPVQVGLEVGNNTVLGMFSDVSQNLVKAADEQRKKGDVEIRGPVTLTSRQQPGTTLELSSGLQRISKNTDSTPETLYKLSQSTRSSYRDDPQAFVQGFKRAAGASARKNIVMAGLGVAGNELSKTPTGQKVLQAGSNIVSGTFNAIGTGASLVGNGLYNLGSGFVGLFNNNKGSHVHADGMLDVPTSGSTPIQPESPPPKLTPAQEEHYSTYYDKQSTGDQTPLVETPAPTITASTPDPTPTKSTSTSTTTTSSTSSTKDDNTSSLDPYDQFR